MKSSYAKKGTKTKRSRKVLPALMTLLVVSAVVSGIRSKSRRK